MESLAALFTQQSLVIYRNVEYGLIGEAFAKFLDETEKEGGATTKLFFLA